MIRGRPCKERHLTSIPNTPFLRKRRRMELRCNRILGTRHIMTISILIRKDLILLRRLVGFRPAIKLLHLIIQLTRNLKTLLSGIRIRRDKAMNRDRDILLGHCRIGMRIITIMRRRVSMNLMEMNTSRVFQYRKIAGHHRSIGAGRVGIIQDIKPKILGMNR